MKRNNKKGFTIVELVIVIAVIGILAAVLIPTFSNVTKKAKDSAAIQNARNDYMEYVADHSDAVGGDFIIGINEDEDTDLERYIAVVGGQIKDDVIYTTMTATANAEDALDAFTAPTGKVAKAALVEGTTNIYAVTFVDAE